MSQAKLFIYSALVILVSLSQLPVFSRLPVADALVAIVALIFIIEEVLLTKQSLVIPENWARALISVLVLYVFYKTLLAFSLPALLAVAVAIACVYYVRLRDDLPRFAAYAVPVLGAGMFAAFANLLLAPAFVLAAGLVLGFVFDYIFNPEQPRSAMAI